MCIVWLSGLTKTVFHHSNTSLLFEYVRIQNCLIVSILQKMLHFTALIKIILVDFHTIFLNNLVFTTLPHLQVIKALA